jgi:sugar transferase EpsL
MTSDFYRARGKRWLDVALAGLAIALFSPLLLLLALLVRIELGVPVLFRQMRPGRDGKPFQILKFRTMTEACAQDGTLLPDADRLTAFGRLLRRTSLDELPELVNVLRGEMSLIGPRPLLMAYLSQYSVEQQRRHLVPPGMTGWVQVNGGNTLSWEQKFALDVWYVEHQSFGLDMRILAMTVPTLLKRAGINAPDVALFEDFHSARQ